jgi:hypothetical protein
MRIDCSRCDAALRAATVDELAVAVWSLVEDLDFREKRVAAARDLADTFTARAGAQVLLALGARLSEPVYVNRLIIHQGARL